MLLNTDSCKWHLLTNYLTSRVKYAATCLKSMLGCVTIMILILCEKNSQRSLVLVLIVSESGTAFLYNPKIFFSFQHTHYQIY